MRFIGRICYGIAAALGVLSLGVEWQTRQKQVRGLFVQHPSHTGLLVALWAGLVALMGKVIEDTGRPQPLVAGTTEAVGTRIGTDLFPPLQKRAKTLRSDYDLGDQFVDAKSNMRPLVTAR